jgi:hypothetical protein
VLGLWLGGGDLSGGSVDIVVAANNSYQLQGGGVGVGEGKQRSTKRERGGGGVRGAF